MRLSEDQIPKSYRPFVDRCRGAIQESRDVLNWARRKNTIEGLPADVDIALRQTRDKLNATLMALESKAGETNPVCRALEAESAKVHERFKVLLREVPPKEIHSRGFGKRDKRSLRTGENAYSGNRNFLSHL
ncbi:MAG: hypothetical protein PHE68_00525 [Candidatus Peribacteraceae bacterium]|nr:hypothetical protein [Candidatus Peribacteraceae bacterium]MDD5074512.1 hypothetical protein [Candidatus Peribacteraceae bacterium]